MDEEDFLAAVEADNAAGVEEVEDEAVQQPTPEPKQPEPQAGPAPTPEPVIEQPAPQPDPEAQPAPQTVPLSALLDERDKRKAEAAELARYRQQEQERQQQPAEVPDMFADPEAYQAYQQQATQQAVISAKLDISEDIARSTHGDELVDQARDWVLQKFQTIPGYQAHVLGQRNPYAFVVAEYRKSQVAEAINPDDFAQFQAWKAAQTAVTQAQQPQAAANPTSSRTLPPRSLASAPSAGGVTTEAQQSDEEMFNEVMSKG